MKTAMKKKYLQDKKSNISRIYSEGMSSNTIYKSKILLVCRYRKAARQYNISLFALCLLAVLWSLWGIVCIL